MGTPEENLQHYNETMGADLGSVFHRLLNDCTWLHLKWNEFVELFGKNPAQLGGSRILWRSRGHLVG
jgi:hypothetical protein